MRARRAIEVLPWLALTACLPTPSHRCSSSDECGDGLCLQGACAFGDNTCPSELRYGAGAGPRAGTCVEVAVDAGPIDAVVDAASTTDEDGDGVADRLDNCPHVANAGQADTTEQNGADGVGDACDPEPTARNRLLVFDGFTASSADWTTSGASTGQGVLRLSAGGFLTSAVPLPRHVQWQIGARVTAPNPGELAVGAGLQLGQPNVAAICTQTSTPTAQMRLHTGDNQGVTGGSVGLPAGVRFTLAVTTAIDAWSCRLDLFGSGRQLRHAPLVPLPATGTVGVQSASPLELEWVVAIAMATP